MPCALYVTDRRRERIPRVISAIPAIIAPQIPSKERVVTITAAMNTPKRIDIMALWNLMLKRNAATEPVQAPVMGKGMATKSIRPIDLYLSTTALLLLVRLNSQSKKILKNFILLSSLEKGPSNSSMGETGIIFPTIAMGTTINQGILKKFMPAGIPPRSSNMGSIEIISTARKG